MRLNALICAVMIVCSSCSPCIQKVIGPPEKSIGSVLEPGMLTIEMIQQFGYPGNVSTDTRRLKIRPSDPLLYYHYEDAIVTVYQNKIIEIGQYKKIILDK